VIVSPDSVSASVYSICTVVIVSSVSVSSIDIVRTMPCLTISGRSAFTTSVSVT
jgi:hypothetical protein